MPRGHHIAKCLHCGKEWMVGDCVPSICDECEKAGHRGLLFDCPICSMPFISIELKQAQELIRAKDHELSLLRDLARQHEADRDRAEKYERQLIEIGRLIGCNHHDDDFGLTRCVSDLVAERDHLKATLQRFRHIYKAKHDGTDQCGTCGLDIRNSIHFRYGETH